MDQFESALSRSLSMTGFPFEHHAFVTAQRHGWNTRSSRLYIDPDEHKTREMDLLCYRISRRSEVTTCTALIVSCKARRLKPWVLLTRPWPDRTLAWYPYPPVSVWTNSEALRFEVEQPEWGLDYFNLAEATGLREWSKDSAREVFALHEFEQVTSNQTKKGTVDEGREEIRFRPLGDSSLYEGTMSLLKALAYELKTVPARKNGSNEKIVYQFNLIQLLDGDLFEAAFGPREPKVTRIERYRYFARTMLDGKEFSARIDFCTRTKLDSLFDELTKLHNFNALHFDGRVQMFYQSLLSSSARLNALLPLLERRLTPIVSSLPAAETLLTPGWAQLEPTFAADSLTLRLRLDEKIVQILRASPGFRRQLGRALQDIYRYEGPVALETDDDVRF